MKIAINPKSTDWNRFAEAFSACLADDGVEIVNFSWAARDMARYDIVIFHWPSDVLGPAHIVALVRALWKYTKIIGARRLASTRFIWVAHNALPHEKGLFTRFFMRSFIKCMDGVIHLSAFSQEITHRLHGRINGQNSCVTVHGHYRDLMRTAPSAPMPAGNRLQLGFFGLIRPYKNLERLLECVATNGEAGPGLIVAGKRYDPILASQLDAQYGNIANIELDMRDELLPDEDIEATIDRSDAIILPYRSILNSGAAILALSRNRPVIAPREGSLPELRESVGAEWMYLYDGELTAELILEFGRWLRESGRAPSPDLSNYSWERVGRDLRPFVQSFAPAG